MAPKMTIFSSKILDEMEIAIISVFKRRAAGAKKYIQVHHVISLVRMSVPQIGYDPIGYVSNIPGRNAIFHWNSRNTQSKS